MSARFPWLTLLNLQVAVSAPLSLEARARRLRSRGIRRRHNAPAEQPASRRAAPAGSWAVFLSASGCSWQRQHRRRWEPVATAEDNPVRLVLEMRTAARKLASMMVSHDRDSLRRETFHLSPVYHAGTADPRHATRYLVVGEINEHAAISQLPCGIVQVVIAFCAVDAERPIRRSVTSCELPADKERGPCPADRELAPSERRRSSMRS